MTDNDLGKFIPLLGIVCCPFTRTSLSLISRPELELLLSEEENKRIPESTIGAMVSKDAAVAFPIIGNIVSFLIEDTLRLSQKYFAAREDLETSINYSIKKSVKEWYDNFGWRRNPDEQYGDTSTFSQVGQSAHGYYEMDSHLQFIHHLMGGVFLLDAASGAIPHPEYLAYSWFYQYRVCVDISIAALQEAAFKIGGVGFYCLADICHLPFQDNVFDGIVSGYTVQHVPESDQMIAVKELYRVLASRKHCYIMTSLRFGNAGRAIRQLLGRASGFVRMAKKLPDFEAEHKQSNLKCSAPSTLYNYSRNIRWWKKAIQDLDCEGSATTLRVFSKAEFENFFGNSFRSAMFLRQLERSFPSLLNLFCQYGLIHIVKN